MTPDIPKGPESDPLGTVRVHPDDDPASPSARRKVKLPITREPGAYWRDLTPAMGTPPYVYSNEAIESWAVQALADVARALGHPFAEQSEVERLTAEVALYRERDGLTRKALQNDGDGPLQFAALIVRQQRDKALAEVSRLREQLAAQPRVPADVDELVSVALNAATNRCNAALSESLDIALTGAVMDLLKSWGVSSSEVEAPQPRLSHKVTIVQADDGMYEGRCSGCTFGSPVVSSDKGRLEDWKGQHEADTLRPAVGGAVSATVHGKENGAETFVPQELGPPGFVVPQGSEGRPSGSERLAPRPGYEWCEKCQNFISGSHYHCAKCGQRSGMLGHSMRPCPTRSPEDAASAARSEATPEDQVLPWQTPRLRSCVERWPDCEEGAYNPSCCRFPKSCSCTVYDESQVTADDLESPSVSTQEETKEGETE